jgi:hypothetical protein
MPKLRENSVPSYRLHRQSGQAIVTLGGRDILLGPYGSVASKTEYRRWIAEWIANGRPLAPSARNLTISELIESFKTHAEDFYGISREADNYRYALRPLRRLYGGTPAADFGPLKLEAALNRAIEYQINPPTNNRLQTRQAKPLLDRQNAQG